MWNQEDNKAGQVLSKRQNPLFTIVTWKRTGQTRQIAKKNRNECSYWFKKKKIYDRDEKVKIFQDICTGMCISPPEYRPNGDPLNKHNE